MTLQLTKEQQVIAAGAVGLAALLFCGAQFFWLPVLQRTAEIQAKIESLDKEIDSAQSQANRLPQLEKRLASLNARKIESEQRLPKAKFVPDILVALGKIGVRQRVTLHSFSPGGSKDQQYFIELHFPVVVHGSFHSIGKFFAALALEPRLYNVYNVIYSEEAEASGEMQATFELVAYQYKGG